MEVTTPHSQVAPRRRAKLRERTVDEIKEVAVRIIERDGASSLTMREIAREMSTAPSALYRYFDGRDALLSALVADAFDELGAATEAAVGAEPGLDPHAAWARAARAIRQWGLAHPSRWGLIYGTPIPGYVADADLTTQPAMRSTSALTRILVEARAASWVDPQRLRASKKRFAPSTLADIGQVAQKVGFAGQPELLAEGIAAWSQLIGIIDFEIFNHLAPLMADPEPFFEQQLQRIGSGLPFTESPKRAAPR